MKDGGEIRDMNIVYKDVEVQKRMVKKNKNRRESSLR